MSCVPSWFFEGRFQCKSASQKASAFTFVHQRFTMTITSHWLLTCCPTRRHPKKKAIPPHLYFGILTTSIFSGHWNSTFIRKPDFFSQENSIHPSKFSDLIPKVVKWKCIIRLQNMGVKQWVSICQISGGSTYRTALTLPFNEASSGTAGTNTTRSEVASRRLEAWFCMTCDKGFVAACVSKLFWV